MVGVGFSLPVHARAVEERGRRGVGAEGVVREGHEAAVEVVVGEHVDVEHQEVRRVHQRHRRVAQRVDREPVGRAVPVDPRRAHVPYSRDEATRAFWRVARQHGWER